MDELALSGAIHGRDVGVQSQPSRAEASLTAEMAAFADDHVGVLSWADGRKYDFITPSRQKLTIQLTRSG